MLFRNRVRNIIYNKEYFCFIELKKVQKRKNRAKNTARTQLLSTIENFLTKVEFKDMILEAYVCVGSTSNPAMSASSQSAKLEFENVNTKLYHDCEKNFDE